MGLGFHSPIANRRIARCSYRCVHSQFEGLCHSPPRAAHFRTGTFALRSCDHGGPYIRQSEASGKTMVLLKRDCGHSQHICCLMRRTFDMWLSVSGNSGEELWRFPSNALRAITPGPGSSGPAWQLLDVDSGAPNPVQNPPGSWPGFSKCYRNLPPPINSSRGQSGTC